MRFGHSGREERHEHESITRLRQALFPLPFGLFVLLGSMMYPSPSWAWGDLGHKIICQIAFEELNNKARNEVIRLIALDGTFNSFTDACTWPDHPRKRAEEHFINTFVRDRLKRAGIRLADLLNKTLGQ